MEGGGRGARRRADCSRRLRAASASCLARLLLAVAILTAPTPALGRASTWPWSWHSNSTAHGGEELNQKWAETLAELWRRSKGSVGFCIGRSQLKAQRLMSLSFPWPLPVSPDVSDVVCSNRSAIEARLCSPLEVELYYRYMLLTDDIQKVPDNEQCTAGGSGSQPACAPGFFDTRLDNRPAPAAAQEPAACCEGYFCPSQLTCMVPCPLGAYCPRAWPALPPDAYKGRGPGSEAKWCAPYAYKERMDLGCGGAHKWSIVPGSAFPLSSWTEGSGSIFCDGGSYCPNTTTRLDCTDGHFCRQGETESERCPPGAACPPNTEIPASNYTGVTVDALLFGVLWVCYLVSQQYNRVLLQLNQKERLKISWGAAPEIRVVQAAPARARTPTPTSATRSSCGPRSNGVVGSPAARRGLLGLLARQRATAAAGHGHGGNSQVWAAFRGPDAEPEGSGYEPLLSLAEQCDGDATGSDADAVELAQAAAGAAGDGEPGSHANGTGAPPGSAAPSASPLAGWSVERMESVENEDDLTPHGLHARLLAQGRQSLLSSPLSSVHAGTGVRQGGALHVEFRELGLRLRQCGRKTVLQGVTGVLPGGRVTAIMGPSGAGKTTLLNVLGGKAQSYGSVSGSIFINGRLDRLERYPMGFVPQDDIMHASLTVYENLLFSARFRLPAQCGREQHMLFVERTIAVLQLEDVRDCQIGDEDTRGISGGQRKRVNVGLELVADPSLLLLDEPTSGLDSTASKALVAALQAVSRSGVTCCAVVHQPSWLTCLLFDHLLLLGKGGRTVFCGPMSGAQPYFEGLGFEFPAHQNPADAFLDITSGELLRPGQAGASELFDLWEQACGREPKPALVAAISASELAPALRHPPGGPDEWQQVERDASAAPEGGSSELLGDEEERRSWRRRFREAALFAGATLVGGAADAWRTVKESLPQLEASWLRKLFVRHNRLPGGIGAEDGIESVPAGGGSMRAVPRRTSPGFFAQFSCCLGRAVLKRTREPLSICTDYAIFGLTGLTLGLISDRGRRDITHFAVSITYSVVALGLLSTVGALSTFGRPKDRVAFYREAASGLNRLAYFAALEAFDHSGTVMRAAVYFIVYYSFAAPRAVIWQMLLVSVAITYCCTGLAYLLSQTMEPSAAQLSAAVLALINTLVARQSDARGALKLAQAFSFARWGLEGYVLAESNKLTGVWLLARCADLENLHYDVRNFGTCLLALFGLGLMFRAAALLALFTLNRDKQR